MLASLVKAQAGTKLNPKGTTMAITTVGVKTTQCLEQ